MLSPSAKAQLCLKNTVLWLNYKAALHKKNPMLQLLVLKNTYLIHIVCLIDYNARLLLSLN